ncbi:unnamed protein product [Ilex paraguariensis]|uniref:Uncharacterized protein n=2 Tax=Ilex paraguariensis TaxID=185542 RepID=A0ABC8UHR2_9AQUA
MRRSTGIYGDGAIGVEVGGELEGYTNADLIHVGPGDEAPRARPGCEDERGHFGRDPMGAADREAPWAPLEGRAYHGESAEDEAQIREAEALGVDVKGDVRQDGGSVDHGRRVMLDDKHWQWSPQLGSPDIWYGQVLVLVALRNTRHNQAIMRATVFGLGHKWVMLDVDLLTLGELGLATVVGHEARKFGSEVMK